MIGEMVALSGAFKILGVAVGSTIVEKVAEHFGYGQLVPLIKLGAYFASAYICFDLFTDAISFVKMHVYNYHF